MLFACFIQGHEIDLREFVHARCIEMKISLNKNRFYLVTFYYNFCFNWQVLCEFFGSLVKFFFNKKEIKWAHRCLNVLNSWIFNLEVSPKNHFIFSAQISLISSQLLPAVSQLHLKNFPLAVRGDALPWESILIASPFGKCQDRTCQIYQSS